MDVQVVDHPLAKARLSQLRDARTENASFRAALRDLTVMLIYEATRDAKLVSGPIHTPVARTLGYRLANPPLLVPVLRAGLGMAEAAFGLMPEARMGFVGLARDEETFEPRAYLESLPTDLSVTPVLVLDPMLATGGSTSVAVSLCKRQGARRISLLCVVAAPEGVERLAREHPDVRVFTAACDRELNEQGYILPGLGDAGDRLFGTR